MAGNSRDSRRGRGSFEDISSGSGRPSGSSGRRPRNNVRQVDFEIPAWEPSPPERERPRRSGTDRRSRPSTVKKRGKKRMSNGLRRLLITIVVLVMAGATILLAVSLLFKISEISVTGDAIEGYSAEEVIRVCGYQTGDNLFFISTRDKETMLTERMPYIEEAKISRHLPGTLEIHLTGARVSACVSSGSSWVYVNSRGKVLELGDKPKNGVLQVVGLVLTDPIPGREMQAKAAGNSAAGSASEGKEQPVYDAFRAYGDIAQSIAELGAASDFTMLNLTDLSDIRLLYQNRIEFRLGPAVELNYKIGLGLRSEEKIDDKERGIMDLSTSDETKRAVFSNGEIGSYEPSASQENPGGAAAGPVPGPVASPSPTPTPNPRGDDIPDLPYSGG